MTALLHAYREQLADFRARKVPLVAFLAPCCGEEIESPKPPLVKTFGTRRGPQIARETQMECPHCGEMFRRIINGRGDVEAWALNANAVMP